VQKIIERMCVLAEQGSVSAAKLILDKVLSNAQDSEDTANGVGGITIVIENATAYAQRSAAQPKQTPAVVDGEFTEGKKQ